MGRNPNPIFRHLGTFLQTYCSGISILPSGTTTVYTQGKGLHWTAFSPHGSEYSSQEARICLLWVRKAMRKTFQRRRLDVQSKRPGSQNGNPGQGLLNGKMKQ